MSGEYTAWYGGASFEKEPMKSQMDADQRQLEDAGIDFEREEDVGEDTLGHSLEGAEASMAFIFDSEEEAREASEAAALIVTGPDGDVL